MTLGTQTEIRMRKSVTGLIASITLSMISVVEAGYIIQLKNGNEYVTTRYWQEGTQVYFDTYGGVFGIDKMFVGKIEKTDKVIKLLTDVDLVAPEKPQATVKESKADATKQAPASAEKAPVKIDQNDPVYKEFTALKARSDSLRTMSRSELDEYAKTIGRLMSKIQMERKTSQFRQEYSELNALANSVEETIKSRR
jgi:cell fate (sporulation/competence/biofilm development) regulator YlbF (YheA/YmcA/DUF963 family)